MLRADETFALDRTDPGKSREMSQHLPRWHAVILLLAAVVAEPGCGSTVVSDPESTAGRGASAGPTPEMPPGVGKSSRWQSCTPFTEEDLLHVSGAVREGDGLRLPAADLFEPGLPRLRAEGTQPLVELSNLLRTKYPSRDVVIEGHSPDDELHTKRLYRSAFDLAYARIASVQRYLHNSGVAEDRFVLVSYGANKPLDPTHANTTEGRRENDRVVIRLLSP